MKIWQVSLIDDWYSSKVLRIYCGREDIYVLFSEKTNVLCIPRVT